MQRSGTKIDDSKGRRKYAAQGASYCFCLMHINATPKMYYSVLRQMGLHNQILLISKSLANKSVSALSTK
jgi:hypothetical protein